jgi:hypothetical protein
MYNNSNYQVLSQPVGRFSNTGLSNMNEKVAYPLYQKQEEMGFGKKRKSRRNNQMDYVKKYEKKIIKQKKQHADYPDIYKAPFQKMAEQTNGTLTGRGRGRPKKVKADAPIDDIKDEESCENCKS